MKPADKVLVFSEHKGEIKKKAKDDRWLVEWKDAKTGTRFKAEVAEQYLKPTK